MNRDCKPKEKTINKRYLVLAVILCAMPFNQAAAELVCPFTGQVDFGEKKFNLTLQFNRESSISFEGASLPEDNYHLLVQVNHFKTTIFDLSTEFESFIGVTDKDDAAKRSFQGQIKSRYSLINYKPFRELSGFFEMKGRKLYLESLSLGGVTLSGTVELFSPYKVDLSLLLNEIKMADFLSFWGVDEDLDSQGSVSGHILVSGILDQLGLKGSLASYNGFVDQLQYDSIVLNLDGVYPIIHLNNSRVAQTDGMTFNLEGDLDLTKKEEFPEQIAALNMLPLISEDKSSREWTIKSKESSPTSHTTEFKYFLRKEHSDTGTLKEESDMLGVERSIKF